MIKIEKNKLIIEFETPDPEEIYKRLLKDIPMCIQAIVDGGLDERDVKLPDSLSNLIDLYKAMLPTGKQVDQMLKNGK
jgi:hypothetical protein